MLCLLVKPCLLFKFLSEIYILVKWAAEIELYEIIHLCLFLMARIIKTLPNAALFKGSKGTNLTV